MGESLENLERAVMAFWAERCVVDVLAATAWVSRYGCLRPRRYMDTSSPKPHRFGYADAKAVMRRLRRGKRVSADLIRRAQREYWREARARGAEDAYDDC